MYIQSTMSRLTKVIVSPIFRPSTVRGVLPIWPMNRVADMRERMNPEEFRTAVAEQGDLDREAFHVGRRMFRQSQKSRKRITRALYRRRHDGIVEREIDEFIALGHLHDRLAVGRLRGGRARGAEDERKAFGRPARGVSRRHDRRLSGAGAWGAGRYGLVATEGGKVQCGEGCSA